MLTFMVEPEQLEVNFTVPDLKEFSKNVGARVIIRGSAVIENGEIIHKEEMN